MAIDDALVAGGTVLIPSRSVGRSNLKSTHFVEVYYAEVAGDGIDEKSNMNKTVDGLRSVARAAKRALAGPQSVDLLGQRFSVAYEARDLWTEPDYVVIRELARGKRCAFDVGANKGAVALIMTSVLDPAGITTAFDASEEACRIVIANSVLNNLDARIRVVNTLVGDISGTVADFYWSASSVFASVFEGRASAEHNIVRLTKSVITLDDYAQRRDLSPDFIKIDVEGAERAVITGMRRILSDHRPIVFVEVHTLDTCTVVQNLHDIIGIISTVGYRTIQLTTMKEISDVNILDGIKNRTYVLLLPVEMPISSLPQLETSGLT